MQKIKAIPTVKSFALVDHIDCPYFAVDCIELHEVLTDIEGHKRARVTIEVDYDDDTSREAEADRSESE